ncbi:T-cell immunoglobulin and mucin domain-containing protein 4-like isoform X5 [Siniperca chuatsi]|uniref:T-cell immunoglobulin and mucin domain-containing protein 4-like isoform X5 n=1 Tax=Siniperca chuatsi TaxID=119488 RepID=UPI001CE2108C|nr:T-cell immunoglobulin and mucin domain-containing protein 4-like isoform X5 [Siniperca chuatsi]
MPIVLLLALLTVSERVSSRVVGQTGQSVTLPCKYDISKHGAMFVCWGRGEIPLSGCRNLLVSTDGHRVKEETRASSRYQLLGRLDAGDVSLTILNLTETDAGRYGCRVEVPGWFNDDKHVFDVSIERAPQTNTSTTTNTATPAAQTTAGDTAGQMTSTETQLTSSFNGVEAEQETRSMTLVLVCVLFGLVALVTAGGVVIIARRWRRLKIPQQQVSSSVRFGPTSSTLQLHSRGSAVENIYQIDGGGDGGEYEYCP